jgi:hypothetical protein
MHADAVSIDQITTFPSRVDEKDHDDGRKDEPPGSRTLFGAILVSYPETDQRQDHGSHISDHVIPGVPEIPHRAIAEKVGEACDCGKCRHDDGGAKRPKGRLCPKRPLG